MALLRTEASLQQALLQGASAAVSQGPPDQRAEHLRAVVGSLVLAGRQASRRAAVETIQPQIELASKVNPNLSPLLPVTTNGHQYDAARAVSIASSFTGRWRGRTAGRLVDGADIQSASAGALSDEVWRLEMIATTEAAEAFDRQREDDLDAYATTPAYQEEKQTRFAFIPFKWWNAVLDKRTCRICSVAHGKIVLLGLDFPEGRPGGVHPRCRCVADIVLLPAWYSQYDTALEAAA